MARQIAIGIRRAAALLGILAWLAFSSGSNLADEPTPKRLLLIGQGPDGHPAGTHEYMAGVRLLQRCLRDVPQLKTRLVQADGPWSEGPGEIAESDGVVMFLSEGAKWIQADKQRLAALQGLAKRGGGLVALHWAMGTKDARNIAAFRNLVGGCHGGPDRKYKVLPDAHVQVAAPNHPVTRGIGNFRVREEFYYQLKFVPPPAKITPILQVPIDGNTETVAWVWQRDDGGRSFGLSGCHFHDNWRRTEYRRLVCQAILWTLDLPIPADGLNVTVRP